MPISNDNGVFDNEFESVVSSLPKELQKVYVMSENIEDRRDNTSFTVDAPSKFEEQTGIHPSDFFFGYPRGNYTSNPVAKDLGYNDIKKPTAIDTLEFINTVENMNDPWKGGQLPPEDEVLGKIALHNKSQREPEILKFADLPSQNSFESVDWTKLNQAFGTLKSTSPEDTPIIAKTPSGMVITEGDVNQAINVGMGAGPGTIAGVRARTAKLGRLGTGATGDELFQKTGWWKGGDGKYRYEISDEGMKLVDKDWRYGDKGVLGDFIEHPELFKAYPEFKNIKFEVGKKGDEYIASFNPNTKTIKINPDAIKEGDEGIKDILIHEIQHAVQTKEGFAMGSNPTYAADQALAELAEKIFPLADGPQKKELLDLYGELKKNKEDFGHYMYLRSPGEIEANIVAARRLLSDEMRKKFPVEEHKKMIEGEKSNYGNTYLPEFWYPMK